MRSFTKMWVFKLLEVCCLFSVQFLPIVVDTGVQIWNGVTVNDMVFRKNPQWIWPNYAYGYYDSDYGDYNPVYESEGSRFRPAAARPHEAIERNVEEAGYEEGGYEEGGYE